METITKKKDRTANWRDCEIRHLISLVEEHQEGLFATLSNTWTAKKKNQLWKDIALAINARGEQKREWTQIKKKWSNLKARAIAYASRMKRVPTGGGSKEKEEWWADSVLNIIGKENMVITGINLHGSGESAVMMAQLNDSKTVSEDDSFAIATEDQASIMQQMTEEVQENCKILADAINFYMPDEHDTVAGSSLPQTSTPKRPLRSIQNGDSHTAEKVKQYGGSSELSCSSAARLQNTTAPTLESTTIASTRGSCTIEPTGNSGSSSSDKAMNRLRQLQQKRRRSNDSRKESTLTIKDQKEIALIDKEMQRMCTEHDFILERRALLKVQLTNARLEQLKLYYQIKELEQNHQVPVEKAVENMTDLIEYINSKK